MRTRNLSLEIKFLSNGVGNLWRDQYNLIRIVRERRRCDIYHMPVEREHLEGLVLCGHLALHVDALLLLHPSVRMNLSCVFVVDFVMLCCCANSKRPPAGARLAARVGGHDFARLFEGCANTREITP